MNFQISRAETLGTRKWGVLTGATGPWRDGFRVRMIEYPRLAPPEDFVPVIGAANIGEPDRSDFEPGKPWKWGQTRKRLEYNVGTAPGAYFPPAIRHDFTKHGDYDLHLTPAASRTAADVIEDMFRPSDDFWGRTWIWCDHAMSAVNIEALRFALRRRHGNDEDFNRIVTDHSAGYMMLGAFVGKTRDANHLQSASSDPYFSNIKELKLPDLEVGDQLIFWNSFVYGRISSGDWALENAYVMEIDSDAEHGSLVLRNVELQGHGTKRTKYTQYQDEISAHLGESLADCRRAILRALTVNPDVKEVEWKKWEHRLRRWDPYETFPGHGAWWVRIGVVELRSTRDRDWDSIEDAMKAMPGTFRDLPAAERGVGYSSPNPETPVSPENSLSVYFPLWQPKGGWKSYFDKRRRNPHHPLPALVETRLTGDIMPGLYEHGEGKPIPVVKPKVG